MKKDRSRLSDHRDVMTLHRSQKAAMRGERTSKRARAMLRHAKKSEDSDNG